MILFPSRAFVLCLTCLIGIICFAPVTLGANEVGLRLPALDRLLERWDRKDAPGVIVGVARDGQIVHAAGYGMANLEHAIPLTAGTISESGSVAKQFTAAAVVLLAVRGQLELDAPVRRYLPELSAELGRITPRMLLNHTSGLRDIHGLFDLMGRPSYSSAHSNDEVLRVVARQRTLNFEPGAEYAYSNAGYIVAAELVERVAKRTFGAFCTEELFRPRGMTRTQWRDDFTAIVPGRATGYSPRAAGGYRIDLPYSNLVGNGGLLTTVGDLLAWTQSFAATTGEWAEVVSAMQTPGKLNDGRILNYGLGLTIDAWSGEREVAHGGATSGFRTYLTHFPARRTAIAVLSNAGDFNAQAVGNAVARAVLQLPAERRPEGLHLSSEELARYAGLYHSAKTDALLTVEVRDGRLMIGNSGYVATGVGKFLSAGGQAAAEFRSGTAIGDMTLTTTTTNAVTPFARRERAAPAAAALTAYAGTYRSEELDVTVVIGVRNGRLTMTRWPGVPMSAEPTFADGFQFGRDWHGTFRRSADGVVTAMDLTNASGRCRRVEFVRR